MSVMTLEEFRRFREDLEIKRLDLPRGGPRKVIKKNDKWIKARKWYIIDMAIPNKPEIIDFKFDNKYQAYRNIKEFLSNNLSRYWVMKGKIFQGFRVKICLLPEHRIGLSFFKYEYPVELDTKQEMKSYRTRMRYQKRVKSGKKGRLIKNGKG